MAGRRLRPTRADLNRRSQPIVQQLKNGIDLQAAFADNRWERIAVQAKKTCTVYTQAKFGVFSLYKSAS